MWYFLRRFVPVLPLAHVRGQSHAHPDVVTNKEFITRRMQKGSSLPPPPWFYRWENWGIESKLGRPADLHQYHTKKGRGGEESFWKRYGGLRGLSSLGAWGSAGPTWLLGKREGSGEWGVTPGSWWVFKAGSGLGSWEFLFWKHELQGGVHCWRKVEKQNDHHLRSGKILAYRG